MADNPRTTLETEGPKKTGTGWSILATAIVSQGNRTLDGREVQFFLNSIPYDQPVQTDSNGRAQIDIIGIPMDDERLSVEAQVVGQLIRAKKSIVLPKTEKVQKPEIRLEIMATRYNGNRMHASLVRLEKDGKGAAGQICYIDRDPTPIPIQANSLGIATVTLDILPEKRRVLFFLSEKPSERIRVDVKGSKPEQPPIKPAESFSDRMKSAFDEGRGKEKKEDKRL